MNEITTTHPQGQLSITLDKKATVLRTLSIPGRMEKLRSLSIGLFVEKTKYELHTFRVPDDVLPAAKADILRAEHLVRWTSLD